jgi:two-component system chemotaxis response regulator CheB
MNLTKQGRIADSDRGSPAESPPNRVRVLVVDDSALMRRLLCDLLTQSGEIEVVGTARDGREAVLQTARLKPDVITLDVEMPEVSGLEALPSLLSIHDAPVLMVSALTQAGADITLQALELGAFDFLPKPERNQLAEMRACRDLLVSKVLTAAQSRIRRGRRGTIPPRDDLARFSARPTASPSSLSSPQVESVASEESTSRLGRSRGSSEPATSAAVGCIVIGISTGGPQALSQVFPLLKSPLAPILVVQHMPMQFTGVFAERLNRCSSLTIREAADGDPVLPDQVLIAPGGRHMCLVGHPPRVRVALTDDPPVSGHRPSVDVLFQSAARIYQSGAVGIIMTGMGRDGVEGCKAILAAKGFTLGQDEASSAVFGMNKAAFLEGFIKRQFALEELAAILSNIAAVRVETERDSSSGHPAVGL